jgi:4'-phosphopantetheinyl transferase EntD
MDQAELAAAWQALVPTGAVVEVMAYSAAAEPGGTAEAAAARTMSDSRRLEFLSGRSCARRALAVLGVATADLAIAADRGPQWPTGIVGSITHTDSPDGSWAVATVAHSAQLSAIGIDLECCELLDPRAWDVVLTPEERAHLRALPQATRAGQASRIWCAKEAAIKAARGVTEAAEVQIVLSATNGQFRASKLGAPAGPAVRRWEFEGSAALIPGYALAVAYQRYGAP